DDGSAEAGEVADAGSIADLRARTGNHLRADLRLRGDDGPLPQPHARAEVRPVQNLAAGVDLGDDGLVVPTRGAVDPSGLADLDPVTDSDRALQGRSGPENHAVAQRGGRLPARDGGALAHRQVPGDDSVLQCGFVAEVRAVGESGPLIAADLHAVADPDAIAPGAASEQSRPGTDLELLAEDAVQPAAAADLRSVTDGRAGVDLCALADRDLVTDLRRVPPPRPV